MIWEQNTLAELCTKLTDGTHDSPKLQPTGMPFIKGVHVKQGIIDFENCDYITFEEHEKVIKRSKPERNDILLANIGINIGELGYVKTDIEFSIKNVALLKVNQDFIDSRYLYYNLKNPSQQERLRNHKGGSAQPFLSLETLRGYKIQFHKSNFIQRKIASILSAYDDLIENNLKRIKLLEEKAQLHYKELISDGNNEKKYFEEFCSIVQGYAFKSTDFSEDKTFDIVVRMGNFKEGGGLQFDNNTKYLNEHFEYNPKYKLDANDLVMVLSDVTREGRIIGNVGFIPSNDKTYLLNQRVGKIVADEKYKEWLYVTFNSREFKDYCLSCANSATVLNFNNKDLFKFKITIPKETELKEFIEKVKPIFTLISTLGEQNGKLREARDILLPKLMNGQIEV